MIDPRKRRPSELCRLLNSTPLGEVINDSFAVIAPGPACGLEKAGRSTWCYVAWLVQIRHAAKIEPASATLTDLEEVAKAAGLCNAFPPI